MQWQQISSILDLRTFCVGTWCCTFRTACTDPLTPGGCHVFWVGPDAIHHVWWQYFVSLACPRPVPIRSQVGFTCSRMEVVPTHAAPEVCCLGCCSGLWRGWFDHGPHRWKWATACSKVLWELKFLQFYVRLKLQPLPKRRLQSGQTAKQLFFACGKSCMDHKFGLVALTQTCG